MERNVAFDRNYGFWNEDEQNKLQKSKVAIVGVGGDGFQLGQKLAMMGVGHLVVADPESFEKENSNRVPGATVENYGVNKAVAFKNSILSLRPETKVDIFTEGINKFNISEFMHGADLVLDESELTHLELGTMIAREARKNKIPDLLVMNIGFSAIASSFHPDSRHTFEKMMGIPKGTPLNEIAEMKVDFGRCLPYLPNYGDINSLIAVQEGAPLPSISAGVDVASAIGSTEVFLHLTSGANNRKQPTWSPKFRYMDVYENRSGFVYANKMYHYLGLTAMLAKSYLGMNPKASYSKESRDNRNK